MSLPSSRVPDNKAAFGFFRPQRETSVHGGGKHDPTLLKAGSTKRQIRS
jgi:hypothetical protein